jgi:anti-sigma-K factor RskA
MTEPDDDLAELRALGRSLGLGSVAPETLDEPPADLWDRIEAQAVVTTPEAIPLSEARRARRPARVLLAAAAAAVVALVAGWTLVDGEDGDNVVASVTLEQLGASGSGAAELVDDDGHLQLRLDTADLDAGDGFLEVWMIDPDVEQLVSLGPVRADGEYDLPPGLDPEAFPIVDVSVEPIDGDPTHSGNSVLRGQLDI